MSTKYKVVPIPPNTKEELAKQINEMLKFHFVKDFEKLKKNDLLYIWKILANNGFSEK